MTPPARRQADPPPPSERPVPPKMAADLSRLGLAVVAFTPGKPHSRATVVCPECGGHFHVTHQTLTNWRNRGNRAACPKCQRRPGAARRAEVP